MADLATDDPRAALWERRLRPPVLAAAFAVLPLHLTHPHGASADTDGQDDLDLHLFDLDGEFVAGSGGVTSAEQVDASDPAAGDWKLVVHGWETDGADAAYTLSSWQVPSTSAGNMTVTAPPAATLGADGEVEIAWSGLTAETRCLGAVRYTNGAAEIGRTLVTIDP